LFEVGNVVRAVVKLILDKALEMWSMMRRKRAVVGRLREVLYLCFRAVGLGLKRGDTKVE
jgi:hypothetical protein